jgi:sec-independent protein translocase protein TatC
MALDQENIDYDNIEGEKEMTFVEHLEELRWHLIRSVSVVLIAMITAFVFIEDIYKGVILAPAKKDFWTYKIMCQLGEKLNIQSLCVNELNFTTINRTVTGQFMTALTSSIVIGLMVGFPYIFFEVWRFITPGLKKAEKKAARGAVFYVTILLALGILFGYYVVSPLAINFLVNFQLDATIQNQIDVSDYVSFLVISILACGITFQMPVIIFVLSKINLITPKFMREYRRHAFVVILIIAAVITPSPDPFSMMIVAIPLYILYELSINVSAGVEKRRQKAEAEGVN